MTLKNRDLLGLAALVAALVATMSAEYALARAVGFGEVTAACIPASLDVYALRAFAVRRDVPAVVAALITTNALAHLVSADLIPVSVPLVVAVSAIAPLVLYRVKSLSAPLEAQESAEPTPEPAKPERPVEAPVERPVKAPEAKPDPLLPQVREFADKMHSDSGKSPSLRELQAHFSIGQARAQRIRVQLAGGAA
jgi:outer membrane biosynthesis protein TonB